MHNEGADFARTLAWIVNTIAEVDVGDRIRISAAYREAQCAIAAVEPKHASWQLRVAVCCERFSQLKKAGDVASWGWMLAAISERVSEQDLPDWKRMKRVVESAVRLLQHGAPRLH